MRKRFVLLVLALLSIASIVQAQPATPVNKSPLELKWYTNGELSYSVKDSTGNLDWDTTAWWPTVQVEQYGNLVLTCNVGIEDEQTLPCENWRDFFEPKSLELDHEPTVQECAKIELQRFRIMLAAIGIKVELTNNLNSVKSFEVVDVAYIPHEQLGDIPLNAESVIDDFVGFSLDPWQWQVAITSSKQYIVMVISGKNPLRTEENHDYWSRYAVLLKPITP